MYALQNSATAENILDEFLSLDYSDRIKMKSDVDNVRKIMNGELPS